MRRNVRVSRWLGGGLGTGAGFFTGAVLATGAAVMQSEVVFGSLPAPGGRA